MSAEKPTKEQERYAHEVAIVKESEEILARWTVEKPNGVYMWADHTDAYERQVQEKIECRK